MMRWMAPAFGAGAAGLLAGNLVALSNTPLAQGILGAVLAAVASYAAVASAKEAKERAFEPYIALACFSICCVAAIHWGIKHRDAAISAARPSVKAQYEELAAVFAPEQAKQLLLQRLGHLAQKAPAPAEPKATEAPFPGTLRAGKLERKTCERFGGGSSDIAYADLLARYETDEDQELKALAAWMQTSASPELEDAAKVAVLTHLTRFLCRPE